jgi:hypothetical protein
VPNLRGISWVRFGNVETPRRRGYEAARRALADLLIEDPAPAPEPARA